MHLSLPFLFSPLFLHAACRNAEWIPWPIDVFVKEEEDKQRSTGNLQSRTAGHDDERDDKDVLTHRVTEMAFGEGLGRIAQVAWGDSVANIHTAAVPPWMVQSEEEYKRCNQRQLAHSVSSQSTTAAHTQIVFPSNSITQQARKEQEEQKKEDSIPQRHQSNQERDPNWLPNFGGVWQEGPRSKTKQEFTKTLSSTSSSSSILLRPSSVYRRKRQVQPAIQSPPLPLAPPPPQQSSLLSRQHQQRSLATQPTSENRSQAPAPELRQPSKETSANPMVPFSFPLCAIYPLESGFLIALSILLLSCLAVGCKAATLVGAKRTTACKDGCKKHVRKVNK